MNNLISNTLRALGYAAIAGAILFATAQISYVLYLGVCWVALLLCVAQWNSHPFAKSAWMLPIGFVFNLLAFVSAFSINDSIGPNVSNEHHAIVTIVTALLVGVIFTFLGYAKVPSGKFAIQNNVLYRPGWELPVLWGDKSKRIEFHAQRQSARITLEVDTDQGARAVALSYDVLVLTGEESEGKLSGTMLDSLMAEAHNAVADAFVRDTRYLGIEHAERAHLSRSLPLLGVMRVVSTGAHIS